MIATRSAALVLALLAAMAAWLALDRGREALALDAAQRALLRAGQSPSLAATSLDQVAMALERRAIGAHEHGAALEIVARVQLMRAALASEAAGDATALRESGLEHAQRASALRPRWPYAHALVAVARAELGRYDAAFEHAVREAIRLGPHERRIATQLGALWLGAPPDCAVDTELRAAFRSALATAPAAWIDRADRAGKGEAACAMDSLPDAAHARCGVLGWPPARSER